MRACRPVPYQYAATLGLPAGSTVQAALAALQGDYGSSVKLSHADMQELFNVVGGGWWGASSLCRPRKHVVALHAHAVPAVQGGGAPPTAVQLQAPVRPKS